ncbi:hypothetical protein N2152v2_003062 [Parachlorella kessleri]
MVYSALLIALFLALGSAPARGFHKQQGNLLKPEPVEFPGHSEESSRPNIVFILTDDQGDQHMPKLAKYIASEGINFTNYITNYALCCPSRTTILAGMCSHNTGVVGVGGDMNIYNPLGGFNRFNDQGLEKKTGPLHLQQAGYRTGLIGKYLNGYTRETAFHVPPGYDRWFGIGEIDYYNWTASDQASGVNTEWGTAEEDYSTDVLTRKAVEYLHQYEEDKRPFFLYLAPYACHRPHVPANRHIGALKGLKVPRVASWNESGEHLSGKVAFLRDLPPVDEETARALDFEYQTRAETLLAVDDAIEAVVQALEDIGQLDNTYIFYTSDNGYKLGHHRLAGKMSAYENDIRLPFYVRGPGVPRGVELTHLVGNVDFVPTWLDLAGVEDPHASTRDGISLAPILRQEPVFDNPDSHRVGILIEKPTTTGIIDEHVSVIVPPAIDVLNDPFTGRRPVRLPNGSWPSEVVEREFLGKHFNEETQKRLEGSWYFGYEKLAGYQKYLELAKKEGLALDGVIKAANEIFPVAYFGLRTQSAKGKYKYIEYPSGYELYDLDKDPHETRNIFEEAAPRLIAELQNALSLLKVCRGASCHVRSLNVLEL